MNPILAPNVTAIPDDLKLESLWVDWKLEPGQNGKPTKVPYNPRSGQKARVNDPGTGAPFDVALRAFNDRSQYDGIGAFMQDSPFVAVDMDNCITHTGEIEDWALQVIETLRSYTEITPSGRGIRIVCRGSLPPARRQRKWEGGREILLKDRGFVTVTGRHIDEIIPGRFPCAIHERTVELARLHAELWPASEPAPARAAIESASIADDELIQRIRGSDQGPKFDRLWSGDTAGYESHSEADLALCCILAFWTGRDAVAIDRLFRRSGQYRDKWDRTDYAERTITRATSLVTETHCPNGRGERDDDSHVTTLNWEPPLPLIARADLPSFPTHALPRTIEAMVTDLAVAYQVPVDLPAMHALAVLSAACGRRVEVEIWSGWKEPVNIYTAVVLPPAERKTAIVRELTDPLEEYERLAIARMREVTVEAKAERELLDARYRAALKKAIQSTGDEQLATEADVRNLAVKLEMLKVPTVPRLLADDVTPERLVSLMAEQEGRIALVSAEGGVFDMMSGRYSKNGAPNLEVYLKGHAGDVIRVDRQTREPEFIDSPALTLGLAVQPFVIDGLMANAAFRGRGVVARMLYSVPRPMVGRRQVRTRAVSTTIVSDYRAVILGLLNMRTSEADDGPFTPHLLKMGLGASNVFETFAQEIEPQLAEFGDLEFMADWAGKLAGATGRIAALLHCADHWESGVPWTVQVNEHTARAAVEIGYYLIEHAKAVYGRMGADPKVSLADRIRRWIADPANSVHFVHSVHEVTITKRDIYKRGFRQPGLRPEDLDEPLRLLEEHRFLRRLPQVRSGPGRKPSPTFAINPFIWTKWTKCL